MIDFEWSPWWWLLLGVAVLIAAGSVWSYRRADSPATLGRKLLLISARLLVIGLVLAIALNPYRVEQESFREKLEMAVLVDSSQSMLIADGANGQTRWATARELIEQKIQPQFGDDYTLTIYEFGESLERHDNLDDVAAEQIRSDLAMAIDGLLADGREVPLGAVVLISDGQFESETSARVAARKLRQAGIPLFTLTVGQSTEAPDLAIDAVRGKQINPLMPRARLNVDLSSAGFAGQQATLTVRRGDRLLCEKELELNGETQLETLEFVSPFRGFYEYDVSLSVLEGERLDYNNRYVVGLNIVDSPIRVLYMEGTPASTHTLEYSLEQDPEIEVTSLFFPQYTSDFEVAKRAPSQLDARGNPVYNVADRVHGFPLTLDKLL